MSKIWISLLALCIVLGKSNATLKILSNWNHLNLPRSNVTVINFDKDIQLATSNNKVEISTLSDNVLINTPTTSILLTKFDSISFKILSSNSSRTQLNHTNEHNSTGTGRPHCIETPVDLDRWKNTLLNGSEKLESLINSTARTYQTKFCVFNVTNPNAIRNGSKPMLNEICGFKLRGDRKFEVLNWEQNEKYVNLRQVRNYTYVGSSDLLDQNITTLNVPLIYLYNQVARGMIKRIFSKKQVKSFLSRYPLFITKSVKDLMLNGYDDGILRELKNYVDVAKIRLYLPDRLEDVGILSFANHLKESYNKVWTLNTGKFKLEDVGQVVRINGKDQTTCWKGTCNLIQGSEGLIHTPLINETDSIKIYVPQMDRSVELIKEPYLDLSKMFLWSSTTFASGKLYEPNRCYLTDIDELNEYNGVLRKPNLCNLNLPIVYSAPHFLYADNYFKNQIDGLNATVFHHDSYLILDQTGTVQAEERNLQINFDTRSASEAFGLGRFIFPVYWLSDQVHTDDLFN